jgi:hypothetical protein
MRRLGVRMETFVYAAIAVGVFALFLAVAVLAYLNWSPKAVAPVASALMVGAVTALVALVVQLKGTKRSSEFAMSVVLSTKDGRPPLEVPDSPPSRANVQLDELFRFSRPTVNRDGKSTPSDKNPDNDSERIAFASELIQYRLVRLTQELQRGSMKGGYSYGASFATVTSPIKTADSVDYSTAALASIVGSNRFARSDSEDFHWQHVAFPLPKKTTLQLTSPAMGAGQQYGMVIQKPMYFRITMTIQPLPYTSPGVLPRGLSIRPELAAVCQTYHFRVTMTAVFEKITSGNYRTEEYQEWVARLFDGIRDRLAD